MTSTHSVEGSRPVAPHVLQPPPGAEGASPGLLAAGTEAATLLAAMPLPAALHRGGRLLAANEALSRLSGHAAAALLGLRHDDLVIPAQRPALAEATRQCLVEQSAPPSMAAQLQHADGSERPVELHARPVELGGEPAVLLTCLDQSDIQYVQNSLFSLSDMLRQIVDGAPIASMVIDSQHRVTHWNSACERLTGLPRHQIVGSADAWRPFFAAAQALPADLIVDGRLPPAQRERADGLPRRKGDGGVEQEAFFQDFGRGGAWLYLTAAPLHDTAGHVIGAVQTVQDVTERRRAQQELLQHRNALEELVQVRSAQLASTAQALEHFVRHAPIGVAYTEGGRLKRVNAALAQMLGQPAPALEGQPFGFGQPAAEALADEVAALAPGEPLQRELWLRRADAQPIWVQVDAYAADDGQQAEGAWWMMQDRTEIRQAQQELQRRFEELHATNRRLEEAQNQLLQQDKMASIGQLAAGVAHEINNPVGFVSSNLNSLRQYATELVDLASAFEHSALRPQDAQAAAELAGLRQRVDLAYLREDVPLLLDECADGLGRVKKIVQDLKDFSRVDQADWQEADLNAGLESTLNVVRHEVKYKAEIIKQLAPLPPVRCLAGQLNQVFMNLIVNAAHAITGSGRITLSSGLHGPWAWVQVDDTGCGMTPEVLRRIFEPFFTTKDVGKGTGLGLSLSFSNVQKHGGAIHVRSRAGVGSSFRVWVPVGGPESAPPEGPPGQWRDAPPEQDLP